MFLILHDEVERNTGRADNYAWGRKLWGADRHTGGGTLDFQPEMLDILSGLLVIYQQIAYSPENIKVCYWMLTSGCLDN